MSKRTPERGDWLFVVLLIFSFVVVTWAIFGAALWKSITGYQP